MASLFSTPKIPAPPPVPAPAPVPTIDDAAVSQRQQDALLKRRGRAATILTGPQGDLSAPPVSAKTLLGS